MTAGPPPHPSPSSGDEVPDDDDTTLIAACRLASFLVMLPGGVLGYVAAGISGMMIGAFITLLCVLIVLMAALGGGT